MKNGIWSNIQKFFPFIGLATILIVFSFLSGGRLWQLQNLQSVLNTMIPICLGGGGMIFVSAQGSTNMSMGSTLALSGAIAGLVSNALGFWSFVPTALLVGLVVGIFNGVMVSKFKVSSLMVTLSMLIALRALVTLLTSGQPIFVDFAILNFSTMPVKLPIFLGAMVILWYMFEHTKLGHFSRCMGENEMVGRFSGIPVDRYKIFAFARSGLLAGLVGVFTVANIAGVSPTMGNFYEMQVMIAMYVGGIQVRGGAQSKFYKLIVGAMTLAFLQNGLTISRVSSEYSELIQGLILLLVVFFGNFIQKQFVRRQTMLAAKASVAG